MPLPIGFVVKNGWNSFAFVGRLHAGPVVAHLEAHPFPDVRQPDQNPAGPLQPLNGLLRVDDEVEQHLLQLGEARVHLPHGRGLHVERDGRHLEIALPELEHFADDVAEIDVGRRAGLLGAEARQVPDDLAGAATLRLDEARFRHESPDRDPGWRSRSSIVPRMACSGLLSSCATPDTSTPTAARRS